MASLLALLSSGLWGSADYHAGKLSKRFPTIAVLGTSQAIGFVTGVILVILTGAWTADAFGSSGYLVAGACAGISGYLGLISLYAGLSTGRMGVVSPISSLGALIPLAYAIVIKGDQLSTVLSIGVAAALIGGFLASGPEVSQGLPLKPVLLALSAAPSRASSRWRWWRTPERRTSGRAGGRPEKRGQSRRWTTPGWRWFAECRSTCRWR